VIRRSTLVPLSLLPLAAAGCVHARAPDRASLAPVREVSLTIDATIEAIPDGATELRIRIPVPRDEGAQALLRVIPEVPGTPVIVTGTDGNPALLVVIPRPPSTATASATFEVSRVEQRGAGTPHPLAHAEKRGKPERWLAGEGSAEVLAGAKTPQEKARAAFTWVLANASGDCAAVRDRFVSLLRAAQVPARPRDGFALPPDEQAGTVAGTHGWAEWWDPDLGWTPADPCLAGRDPERRDFFLGALDADRVGISLGGASVLPEAEIDGVPVRVSTVVRFRAREP
jgi:hypothetical protein